MNGWRWRSGGGHALSGGSPTLLGRDLLRRAQSARDLWNSEAQRPVAGERDRLLGGGQPIGSPIGTQQGWIGETTRCSRCVDVSFWTYIVLANIQSC